jgi:hypothetical protein
MQTAQEVYAAARDLPSVERLRLAALILDDLARNEEERQRARIAREERRAREIEIINRNADRLNVEALDVLNYQIEL